MNQIKENLWCPVRVVSCSALQQEYQFPSRLHLTHKGKRQTFQVPAKLVLSSQGKVFRKQPVINKASESRAPSKSSSMDAMQGDDSPSQETPEEGNKCDMRGIWMKKKQDSLWEKGEIK